MNDWVTPQKAREILQITNKTLHVWDAEGKIRTVRTPSGHRRYNLEDIQNFISSNVPAIPQAKKDKICYCRVSSSKQMDDLERQKNYFKSRFPDHQLVTDIGSGINWKRKGLQTILERAMLRDISVVVVAHRDRLCRFAFELLEWILKCCDVKLVVLNQEENKSPDAELADDILSIVHVYSCRAMERRKYNIKENQNLPNSTTKTKDEGMDGNTKICV